MASPLGLGLSLFTACWLLHVIIWRIHRPEAYPIWLPLIFVLVPLAGAAMISLLHVQLPWRFDCFSLGVAFLLHLSIAACYMGNYAGIIEYSPSAEILRVVSKDMPDGAQRDTVISRTAFTEEALTGKRIKHLRESNTVVLANGELQLTAPGRRVVALCLAYRAVFGLKAEAQG